MTIAIMATFSTQGLAADKDEDGIFDEIDNCVLVANPNQRDTDADGIGNRCDPDLDNNGIVNHKDLLIFKQRRLSKDSDADLDGNKIVNNKDILIFEKYLNKEPGPSNSKAEPSFIETPPPTEVSTLFTLDKPRENGNNAAIIVNYGSVEGLEPVISLNFEGKTIALNDEGLLPDLEAGDNQYSAFLNYDFNKQAKQEALFKERLNKTKDVHVSDFSGRELIKKRAFKTEQRTKSALIQKTIELVDGSIITPVLFPHDNLPILPVAHDPMRSLLVNDTAVVADPSRTFDLCDTDGDGSLGNVNGVWSFKTLMTNMANRTSSISPITPQQFTHNWVRRWMTSQTVNGSIIFPRPNFELFFPGWDGINASTLDMDNLPFHLLAIVNRIDMAKTSAYGQSNNPGEIRLVFALLDQRNNQCVSAEMTVIFEYGDLSNSCMSLKNRANQWINLSSLVLGGPAYNAALQNITDNVTVANAVPSKPNGSALNQLRTNERAIPVGPNGELDFWQLREFFIENTRRANNDLIPTTIKQTPIFSVPEGRLAAYTEQNAESILCETHLMPESFMGFPFLASSIDYQFNDIWNPNTDPANLPTSMPRCHIKIISVLGI